MQLVDVQRLFKYLDRQPPAHELLAAQLGWKDPGPRPAAERSRPGVTDEDRARLAALERKWGLA